MVKTLRNTEASQNEPKTIRRLKEDQDGDENGTRDLYTGSIQEVKACLRKNNSKNAYQLVNDLATEKQCKSTTKQEKSGKWLTGEHEIINMWI